MPIETLTWLMFGSLFLLLLTGYPLAFLVGGVAVGFIAWLWSPDALALVPQRVWNNMTQYLLAAIPLFIFMASMLEKSGLIEEIFDVAYKWLGRVPGGLAVATIAASTVLAAMVGVIGAAVVTMALVALPSMLRRGYSPVLAAGTVMAGGTLGILIPPSVLAIVYGLVANQSVGELYLGSVLPGLLLSGLYMLFSILYALINPKGAPRIPKEEAPTWAERWRALRSIWAPLVLIFLVLGTIFLGLAAPTEAAAVGAFGAMMVAALHRKLSWQNLRLALEQTAKATAMVLWIIFGANAFVAFYIAQGGDRYISELLLYPFLLYTSPMTVADHLTLNELWRRAKKAKDPIEKDRFLAVYHAKRGLTAKEIARIIPNTPRWVQETVRRYNLEGPEALKDKRHQNPGQKPKLTPEERMRVLEALQGPPPDGGLWTGPKLRDWVERELGKKLSLYPIYRLLHEMGFALRVPRPRHRKADGEAQEAFKKTSSPRSRRRGPRGGG
jgi:tripartite ATP-independent transporter DctM subunit